MEDHGWPVTNAAGEVLGWMCDPDVITPFERRQRNRVVETNAAAVGGLVDALAIPSLDVHEVCESSGLSEPLRDAACYLALSMRMAELGE